MNIVSNINNHNVSLTHKDNIELENNKFSENDKNKIYELYKKTYESIGGELMDKDEFTGKIGNYYDKIITSKNSSGEIENAMACWSKGNSNGSKICLIFGENGKEASQARLNLLKNLLSDNKENFYTEANGAVASALLKDKNVKISMSINDGPSSHYYSVHNSHGKKLIFGNCKNTIPISTPMKEFFFHLFELKKAKIKASQNGENSELKNLACKSFINIFDNVEKAEIPISFKSILLSKTLKNASQNLHDLNEIDEINKRKDIVIEMLNSTDSADISSVFSKPISGNEQKIISDLLEEKIEKSKFSTNERMPLTIRNFLKNS